MVLVSKGIDMTKFLIAAGILTVGTFVTDWARANELVEPTSASGFECHARAGRVFDAACEATWNEADEDCGPVADAAYDTVYDECLLGRDVSGAAHRAVLSGVAYEAASEAVLAAPDFCAVTFIEQDVTHGWRAVCILVSESEETGI
jgi:hypothetical protein